MIETPGARPPVVVHHPYPDAWERLTLLASLPVPGKKQLPPIARGEIVVRAMRARAAATAEYATALERFLDAGWALSLRLGRSFVERPIDTVDEAQTLVDSCGLFTRGQPIELWVAHGTDQALGCGGLLVGTLPHHELCPPRTFPALVFVEHNGAQIIVEDMAALRTVVAEEVAALGEWLDRQPELVRDVGADVPRTLHALADEIAAGGDVPRLVHVNLVRMDSNTEPEANIEVCAVTAALWSGVARQAGVNSYVELTMPYEEPTGIALSLIQRGEAIALDLLIDLLG